MLVSELQVTYKTRINVKDAPQVKCSADSAAILRNHWEDDMEMRERFKVLLLNRASKVIGVIEISSGGVAGTVVDAKLIFGPALKRFASAIVLCHNHPSGNLNPSEPDRNLTKKLADGAKLLDMLVLDHIILGAYGGYYSFADEGLMT